MTPQQLLAERSLLALAPVAARGDLLDPAQEVAIASLDHTATLKLDNAGRALLHAWTSRADRVFLFDDARPALRRLLRAGVDVRRPLCRLTLERLSADSSVHDDGQIARDVTAAAARASSILHKLEAQLIAVESAGHTRVARLECLVLRAFAALEDRGLAINVPMWRGLVDEQQQHAVRAKAEVIALGDAHIARDLFGTPEINLDADGDVRTLIKRVLGAEPSDIGKSTLSALKHPLTDALLRYREAHKIVSTYGEALLSRVDARTHRLHATFTPLGASTGRVASANPNLQNLPSDARYGKCLVPPAGRALITADYGTCELRIVAELAQDPVFLRAFDAGEDLHSTVATSMFGVKVSKTENSELRQRAKAINFGLVYGMGAPALSMSLGVSAEVGQQLLDKYFKTFPRIREHLEDSVRTALARGYSETILGRRLTYDVEQLKSDNARGELGRIMKNMPIQGASADMTKLAMVRVHERLTPPHTRPSAGLVNTIHDELVVECDADEADEVSACVTAEMEQAHRTLLRRVPPLVETHVTLG